MTMPVTMDEIAGLARTYAGARDALAETGEAIREDRRAAVRRRMAVLRRRIAETAAAKEALRDAIAASPELFVKPRTRALEGVKVGWRKPPGRVECDAPAAIAAIRRKLPDQADALIRISESLDKKALRKLKAGELARIGVAIVEIDDEIVIASAPDALDKLVDALIADGEAGP